MSKNVPVSPHLRKGRAVKGHSRTVTSSDQTLPVSPIGGKSSLSEMATPVAETALVDVNRKRVDLRSVEYLYAMDFDRMDLSSYYFSNVKKIESCYFPEANFKDLTFDGVQFIGCNFDEANLKQVTFKNCIFKGCSFQNAKIQGQGNFSNHKDWENNQLTGCSFEATLFENVEIASSAFQACTFDSNEMSVAAFYGCQMSDTQIHDTNFELVDFGDSVFDECTFASCKFRLRKANLVYGEHDFTVQNSQILYGNFSDSHLRGANIVDTIIKDTFFLKTDGPNLNLSGTTIENSSFVDCELPSTDFTGGSVKECEIEETNFAGSEWDNTKVAWGPIYATGEVYEQYSFNSAIKLFGVSEKQFEFMVISKAIEVRDNKTKQKVTSNFDPRKHHIPVWTVKNFPLTES